jgi:hypothetical protein
MQVQVQAPGSKEQRITCEQVEGAGGRGVGGWGGGGGGGQHMSLSGDGQIAA